jgi:hypothetical protein
MIVDASSRVSMKLASASILTVAALSASPLTQIPERAEWEITFAQVEATAGLPDLRSEKPGTHEARVMDRAWGSAAVRAFLRSLRTGGATRAQLFVFWDRRYIDPHFPSGSDVVCRDNVCVRPIAMTQQGDWAATLDRLTADDACPPMGPSFCADCAHVWIKTKANNKYREQSCNAPGPETPAGAARQLMYATAADSLRE